MIDRSVGPIEMWGEPGGECIHGIPDGVSCWQCRYEMLFEDYTVELEAAEDAEDRADRAEEVARAFAERIAELESKLSSTQTQCLNCGESFDYIVTI